MWVVAVWVNARGLSDWGDAEPRRLMTTKDMKLGGSGLAFFSSGKLALEGVKLSGIKSYGIVEIKHHEK